MKRCLITYAPLEGQDEYSLSGLHTLSPQLQNLAWLDYTAAEQRKEAVARAGKMSIQGVQPKLSAQLKVKEGKFEVVDQGGRYILKPQSEYYPELPENEALSMTLAAIIGIEVPVHGLVRCKDKSLTYFIKRFDRVGHTEKLAVEDFTQLLQLSRDTKYESTMEKVGKVVSTFCSFPKIEAVKLLKLTLFNFIIGNEDMHLKNFSLITRDNVVTISPAYDLLNSTIAQTGSKEELALLLNGKKHSLKRQDFIDYFARKQLQLNEKVVADVLESIRLARPVWSELIESSFLSEKMKTNYLLLMAERFNRLGI